MSESRVTRATALFQEDFSSMPLDEKRLHYRCGKRFSTLMDILPWNLYYKANYSRFLRSNLLIESTSPVQQVESSMLEKISVFIGDITSLEIDVIVNAANCSLLGGGGVDAAIHRAAGNLLYDACLKLPRDQEQRCKTGDSKITKGFALPAKYVIHTVGPIGENPAKLTSCYDTSLQLMKAAGLRSIAFPCISTGVYGYPNVEAADVAIRTVKEFLKSNVDDVDRVIFCLFMKVDIQVYEIALQKYFPVVGPAQVD